MRDKKESAYFCLTSKPSPKIRGSLVTAHTNFYFLLLLPLLSLSVSSSCAEVGENKRGLKLLRDRRKRLFNYALLLLVMARCKKRRKKRRRL